MRETASPGIAGIVLQPITMAHLAVLESIGSPMVRRDHKPADFTPEVIMQTVFVLSRPAGESRELLARSREAFDDAAFSSVGDNMTLAESLAFATACTAQIDATVAAMDGAAAAARKAGQGSKGKRWRFGW